MDIKISPFSVFDNHQIEEQNFGTVSVSTIVTEKNLNVYGTTHGGYLFALADEVAGWTAITTGVYVVTLQSNINYIKAASKGDRLLISGQLVHNGRQTKVIEVTISKEKTIIAKASFTMFVTGKVD